MILQALEYENGKASLFLSFFIHHFVSLHMRINISSDGLKKPVVRSDLNVKSHHAYGYGAVEHKLVSTISQE